MKEIDIYKLRDRLRQSLPDSLNEKLANDIGIFDIEEFMFYLGANTVLDELEEIIGIDLSDLKIPLK